MPITDDELIAKIAGGDGSAFAELYDRYYTPVLCFAKKRIWVRQDAEDAAQDVMLRVGSNARLYLQGTSVRAWIYSIAKNVIVDRIRGSGMDAMDRCRRLDGGDVSDGERSHFKSREPEPSCDRLALDEISGII